MSEELMKTSPFFEELQKNSDDYGLYLSIASTELTTHDHHEFICSIDNPFIFKLLQHIFNKFFIQKVLGTGLENLSIEFG